MIRINLFAERKIEKTRKPLLTFDSGNGALGNALMGSIIALALLFCGYQYYGLRTHLSRLDVKIADANREKERLREILKKGEAFKAQRQLLKRKVELITDLKKKQSVPVHLLDQISRNLPEFLWLENMSERDNRITLSGKATTYNAVSNFYNNLDRSERFTDVILGTTQRQNEGVTFSMNCRFVPERDQQKEAAASTDGDGGAAAPTQG
ncbi:MAG: PilN domain-containing protein [Acidobacteriota bacterium]